MDSKRVLVVSQHYKPEDFRINDIVPKLLEDGFEVDVLCGLPNYPEGEWAEGYSGKGPFKEQDGPVTIYRAREVRRKGNTSIRIFLNYISWPVFAWLKAGSLPKAYDCIFCYNTSPVLMCWPANKMARLCKAKLVTYVLDIWPENLYTVLDIKNKRLRKIAQWYSDRAYKRADVLVTMSETLKGTLQQRLGDKCPQVEVVPQHAEDFYAQPMESPEELVEFGQGACMLAFTGNFSPAQNLDGVISAVAAARKASGIDIRLLLVGDGMSRTALEQQVSDLGANEYVCFTGRVAPQQVPAYAAAADAMVLSLSKDPALELVIPAKVASYMAMSKPIVGSLDGEGANAIVQAECGMVAPAGDIDALARVMVDFAQTTLEQRNAFGAKAHAYYQENFSRDAVIGKLEDLMR